MKSSLNADISVDRLLFSFYTHFLTGINR